MKKSMISKYMNDLDIMNFIAIVQQLPEDDINFVQTFVNILIDKLAEKDAEIAEANDSITWWSNRHRALEKQIHKSHCINTQTANKTPI